jgi:multidrug resistance protein MdtO
MSLSVLFDFLRRELTPTPGRGGATFRLTLSCIIATIPIFTHHIPHGMIVMIVMYLVTVEDTAGTLMATVLGGLGATFGIAAALLALEICVDLPWLRICFFAIFLIGGLFLKSTISIPGLGSAIGLPGALTLVIPDILPSDPEVLVDFLLWAWTCMTVGLTVNICVQLLLSRSDPLTLLKRELNTRLRAVENLLENLAENESVELSAASLDHFAIAGMSRPLALLKSAALIGPWVRERREGIATIITLVDRLVTAAAALAKLPAQSAALLPHDLLMHVADGCQRACRAFDELRLPVPRERLASTGEHKTSPVSLLADMEQILNQIASAFSADEHDRLRSTPQQKFSLFVPDAFDNPGHLRFGIKGALAAMICYVLFVGFDYPGIYTSVITCFVVSLSTIGASNQKGLLRFSAAAVGGAMGLFALVYLFPHVDTIGGFWVVFGAGTAVAAWVNFGSPRISYLGYQIGLTFYKSVFQSGTFGPSVSATVLRDRLIGVFLGLIVYGIVEHYLWPVSAATRMRERLADVLRSLGELARARAGKRPAGGRNAEDLRRLISQQATDLQNFIESSKFEIGADVERVERVTADAQSAFVVSLAIARHQKERTELPECIQESLVRLDTEMAIALTALADVEQGKDAAIPIGIDDTISTLENFASGHMDPGKDADEASLESLALYRELAAAVSRLLQSASTKTEKELISPLMSIPDPA